VRPVVAYGIVYPLLLPLAHVLATPVCSVPILYILSLFRQFLLSPRLVLLAALLLPLLALIILCGPRVIIVLILLLLAPALVLASLYIRLSSAGVLQLLPADVGLRLAHTLDRSLLDLADLQWSGGSLSDVASLFLFNLSPAHRELLLRRLPLSLQRALTTRIGALLPPPVAGALASNVRLGPVGETGSQDSGILTVPRTASESWSTYTDALTHAQKSGILQKPENIPDAGPAPVLSRVLGLAGLDAGDVDEHLARARRARGMATGMDFTDNDNNSGTSAKDASATVTLLDIDEEAVLPAPQTPSRKDPRALESSGSFLMSPGLPASLSGVPFATPFRRHVRRILDAPCLPGK
jgi:hypothetical protein